MAQSALLLQLSLVAAGSAALIAAWRMVCTPKKSSQAAGCEVAQPWQRSNAPRAKTLLLSKAEAGIAKITKDHHGAMKVCFRLEVEGPSLSIDKVQHVVQRLQARHAILCCCLQEEADNKLVLRSDQQVGIPVEEMSGGFQAAWAIVEKVPIGLNEPILRVVLTTSKPSRTDVLLICHHAFCDGKSISSLASDFMTLLSTPETSLPPLGYGPPLEVATAATIGGGLVASLAHVVRTLSALLPIMRMPPVARFPVHTTHIAAAHMSRSCSTVVHYLDLDKAQTEQLVQASRRHRTTVTGALGAAIVDAVGAAVKEEGAAVALGCGLDLRQRYRPELPPAHLCYHVGATSIFWRRHRGERGAGGLWELAVEFRREMARSIASGEAMAVASLIADLSYNSPPTHELKLSASISNWGLLPLSERYGPWHVTDARPVVNMAHLRLPAFLATTTAGRLTLTLLAPAPAYDPEEVRRLLAGVKGRVDAMLASG